jgi:hypothetical protein
MNDHLVYPNLVHCEVETIDTSHQSEASDSLARDCEAILNEPLPEPYDFAIGMFSYHVTSSVHIFGEQRYAFTVTAAIVAFVFPVMPLMKLNFPSFFMCISSICHDLSLCFRFCIRRK